MEAGKVFLIFFVFFTVATLAVPVPLFPGNMTTPLFGSLDISLDSPLVNALVNGAFYGFVVWIVFVSVSRKLEEPEAPINPNTRSFNRRSCELSSALRLFERTSFI